MVKRYYIPKKGKSRIITSRKFVYDTDLKYTMVKKASDSFGFSDSPSLRFNLSNYKLVSKTIWDKYKPTKRLKDN